MTSLAEPQLLPDRIPPHHPPGARGLQRNQAPPPPYKSGFDWSRGNSHLSPSAHKLIGSEMGV